MPNLVVLIPCIDMEYQRDAHRVHLVVYHLVWTPKRHKKVLVGRIAEDCASIIRVACDEQRWEILRRPGT